MHLYVKAILEHQFDFARKDTIFIKYIACLKKILSLSFDHNDNNTVEEVMMQPSEYCLSDQFLNLYIDINDLFVSPSKDHFLTLMEDFLSLGISLGYSESTINQKEGGNNCEFD